MNDAAQFKVVLVDDHSLCRNGLTDLLQQRGGMQVVASTGDPTQVVGLLRRHAPDLVVLDLRMPEMDGFKVIQELRGNPETATIPVLIVTGDSISDSEREQLANLSVLHKGDISAEEYRHLIEGVRANLGGD